MPSEEPHVDFQSTLHRLSCVLKSASFDCLLIGGFAVNYYGFTRATLDIDFMAAVDDIEEVKNAMTAAGFSNYALHPNAAFFRVPNDPVRVDFVQTERGSMDQLLAQAKEITVQGMPCRVPALNDLLAMKLFAAANGAEKRWHRDLDDVANLCFLNDIDDENTLPALCRKYANTEIYRDLCQRINNLNQG